MKKEDWISPAFQKYVSITFAQNLLKRVRKPDILLLRPLWAPLGVLSGTEELFVFIPPQHKSVYVVGGVFQTILVQHTCALGKTHAGQPIVLRHNHISRFYPVDESKIHAVRSFVEHQRLRTYHGACFGPDEKEDIAAAEKICKEIGIEFHVFDCAKQYEEIVLNNFKKEYLSGRTPNPCIWCNSLIKFDVLPYLAKENGIEFDKFATGHYARIEQNEDGRYILKQGLSPNKDQSYFLYRLKQEQLANIMLPLGSFSKDEIRNIARSHGLEVAEKPDSQDFYEGDYNELLQVQPKKGNIVDMSGKILGEHEGIWNYTIGQIIKSSNGQAKLPIASTTKY